MFFFNAISQVTFQRVAGHFRFAELFVQAGHLRRYFSHFDRVSLCFHRNRKQAYAKRKGKQANRLDPSETQIGMHQLQNVLYPSDRRIIGTKSERLQRRLTNRVQDHVLVHNWWRFGNVTRNGRVVCQTGLNLAEFLLVHTLCCLNCLDRHS